MSRSWAALPLVVALASALPVLGNGFTNDDELLIVANPKAHDFSHLAENLSGDFFLGAHDSRIGYFRPLTKLAFVVEYQLFRARPLGYHLVSLLWFLVAVLLGFRLALKLGLPPPWAALALSLYAAHPAHAETVAIIASRSDGLVVVAMLACLLWGNLAGAVLLQLAALFCKETALVTPFLLVGLASRRRLAWLFAPMVPYFALRLALGRLPVATQTLPFGEALAAAAKSFVTLLLRALAPLSYTPWMHSERPTSPLGWGVLALLALALILLLWRRVSRPALALLVAPTLPLLLGGVVHVSGDPRVLVISDRWVALPALGAALLLAEGVRRIVAAAPRLRLPIVLTCAVLVMVSMLTACLENASYRSEESRKRFEGEALEAKTQRSAAEEETVLAARALLPGDPEASLEAYRQLVALAPLDYNRRFNLASQLYEMGRDDEALEQARIVYYGTLGENDSLWRHRAERALLIGLILESKGDGEGARRMYRECLRLDPEQREARARLGQ